MHLYKNKKFMDWMEEIVREEEITEQNLFHAKSITRDTLLYSLFRTTEEGMAFANGQMGGLKDYWFTYYQWAHDQIYKAAKTAY